MACSDRADTPGGPRSARPDPHSDLPVTAARRWLLLAWSASAVHLVLLFDGRWIPHDAGTLGQTAWRILLGEVPHRDFDAVYTGLLGYLHAAAMAVGGVDLLTMRVVMLVATLLWIPAFWSLAARLAGPAAAALATVLAVAMGPAIYPVGMPSWYNLYFATWGLLALLRWNDGGGRGWLVAAGACAGLSVLFKVAGLYFLAAALFFALHRELARVRGTASRDREGGAPGETAGGGEAGPLPAAVASALLLSIVVLEVLLVRSQATVRTFIHYVAPTAALAVVAGALAWRRPRPGLPALRATAATWLWIVAGFLVPVGTFVLLFAAAGAADDLWRGVFVLPTRRLDSTAAYPPPPLWQSVGGLVPVALLAAEAASSRRVRQGLALAAAAGGLLVLLSMDAEVVYRGVWASLQPLVALATILAAPLLLRRRPGPEAGVAEAVLWTAALVSLVRFPFWGPVYFSYAAPLGILAALVVLARTGRGSLPRFRPVAAVVAAFYVAFLALGPDRRGHTGSAPDAPLVPLALERAGIDVPAPEAEEYVRVVTLLRELSDGGAVYATPDAPEVYFLTGLRNPTRTLFELFDDPQGRRDRVLGAIDEAGVDAVALNTRVPFSEPDLEVIAELERRYPRATRVGRFIVRWRESGDGGGGAPGGPSGGGAR